MKHIKVVINVTIYEDYIYVAGGDYETAYVTVIADVDEFGASSRELAMSLMDHLGDEIKVVQEAGSANSEKV